MFEMMGHHAFNRKGKEIYWKDKTVEYCDEFLRKLGMDTHEVTYKEAPWVGGGNAGPCLEVIVRGLELATLVFMDLELSSYGDISIKGQNYKKMDTYIVDTGYGLERFVWASKGTPTVYDAVFPEVIEKLITAAGIEHPLEKHGESAIMMEIARLSESMERGEIAKRLDISLDFFKNTAEPIETIYAIADHTKCLAFMLADGIVPSNAKEGYLARLILRRTFRMLKALKIEMPLEEIVIMHVKNLQNSFPELGNSVDRIVELLSLEKRRYEGTLSRGERLIRRITEKFKGKGEQKIPLDKMIGLYDSHGIPPEFVKEVASNMKMGMEVDFPTNFYSLVASMHSEEKKVEIDTFTERVKERTKGIQKTIKLYYEEPSSVDFDAVILDFFDDFLILDKTLFYPEGGGQPSDTGILTLIPISEAEAEDKGEGEERVLKVVDVKDVEGVILHKIEGQFEIESRAIKRVRVRGSIDFNRRIAHTRHHSATHVISWAARKVLGDHIWQAGAQKGERRSRLDITHFKRISTVERREMEMLANKMVMRDEPIRVNIEDRNEAEEKYGFRIYQGGVPIGKKIRIVRIGEDEDVQACAGTHCSKTGEIGPIKILHTERIQDGIERIEYSAGEAAVMEIQEREELISQSASILRVPLDKLPATVKRLFEEWKRLKKENERLKGSIAELSMGILEARTRDISGVKVIAEVLREADTKELMKIASEFSERDFVTLLIGKKENNAYVVSSVPSYLKDVINAGMVVRKMCEMLGGGGGGKVGIAQGGGGNVEKVEEAMKTGLELVEKILKERDIGV
ncbi:MAG: Alanine--tRNA ligase [Candidatus Methanolliviera sp. GoM_asphalt]|nr:MAG: Alanine--tRNA ligase [Candidatus Methanolliviera sp. GoM_asphalt]